MSSEGRNPLSEQFGHVNFDGNYDDRSPENRDLIDRRKKHFAGSFLFYHDPLHIVRGQGVWLYDNKGRRYLDCYNNVPAVGHSHSKVVNAIAGQARSLNTHTRYLSDKVVSLAEDLAATLPGKLDVCLFACTGTEAAELAMRMAGVITGNSGILVMEHAYHGNSRLVGEMSTSTYPPEHRPDHICAVEPPNTYRGPFREDENDAGQKYAELVDPAINQLNSHGHGVSAFVCDMIFDSQGGLEAPSDYFQNVYAKVRAAGGLCVADEVQPGFGRTGKYWGFENYGVEPDIVFVGKPMGNGHPVSAVMTTREIADAWASQDVYFNTFGGNPVSAAAAQATMQVIKNERVLANVQSTGAHLRKKLEWLASRHDLIGDVRGLGLYQAIELVKNRRSREPAPEIARLLPDAMKDEGVLVGLTGRFGNVLKIRPPMIITENQINQLISALDKVLYAVRDQVVASSSSMRINSGVVTEGFVRRLGSSPDEVLSIGRGVIVTPLARDKARELGVRVVRDEM